MFTLENNNLTGEVEENSMTADEWEKEKDKRKNPEITKLELNPL